MLSSIMYSFEFEQFLNFVFADFMVYIIFLTQFILSSSSADLNWVLFFMLGLFPSQWPLWTMCRYILEQSLSVDNLFVFVLIFKYFKVPIMYQVRHKFLSL